MLNKNLTFAFFLAASYASAQAPTAGAGLPPQAGQVQVSQPSSAQPNSPGTMAAAAPSASAPAPKKPGVVRVGVMMPRYDMGNGASSPDGGEPIRIMEDKFLASPKVELINLSSHSPAAAAAEAKAQDCDYVLSSSVVQSAKKSGFGGLRSFSSMANMVPGAGFAAKPGALIAASAVEQGVNVAAQLSSGVKAKSEIDFGYSLVSLADNQKVLGDSQKAKAQSDGQDVISPMIENAAGQISGLLNK